ncbi:MAG: DUF1573 domain-containing protein [Anaerolineae bacterium]
MLTGILVIGFVAGCGGGQPAIDLPQTQHDFGEIQQGEVATIQLPVRNTGEKDLHIESVSTSCGCTSAKVEPMTIPPNGEGTLSIDYNSGLHPDKGPIFRTVYIASDDPETPEAQVEIRGDVRVP